MPLIPALGRQSQADLCEFEASLVYKVSSRTGSKSYTEKPCLVNNNNKRKKRKIRCVNIYKVPSSTLNPE